MDDTRSQKKELQALESTFFGCKIEEPQQTFLAVENRREEIVVVIIGVLRKATAEVQTVSTLHYDRKQFSDLPCRGRFKCVQIKFCET